MGIRVRHAVGPLSGHRLAYQCELEGLGYTPYTVKQHLVIFSQLNRYLADEGIGLTGLVPAVLERFLAARRDEGLASAYTTRFFAPLLAMLRREGAIPPAETSAPCSPLERLLECWHGFVLAERALSVEGIRGYVDAVRPFLARFERGGRVELDTAGAREINDFLIEHAATYAPKTTSRIASALRCFFRFAFATGLMTVDLSGAVPSVHTTSVSLPKFLAVADVQRMIEHCDPVTTGGLRDRAILSLLWRLGLRAGEVAGLQLEDIDWRAGTVTVIGKGRREAQLPVPHDVGQAIAAYLRVRPARAGDRAVFQRIRAPHRGLSSGGVTQAVFSASQRAGLGEIFAHRLRHTAATAMLAGGADLREVGQVLRHESQITTGTYARVQIEALRTLARPWKGRGR